MIVIAAGVPESHIVGPYNISFDLCKSNQSNVISITNRSNAVSNYGILYDSYGLAANTTEAPYISVSVLKYQEPADFIDDDYVKSLFFTNFYNANYDSMIHRPFDGHEGYMVSGTHIQHGFRLYFGLFKIANDTIVTMRSVAPMQKETGQLFRTIHVEDAYLKSPVK